MVATAPRLTLQVAEIGPETRTIRSLDWDRSRFDIEFGLQNGTTYNAFLIRGEKTALIDTSHEKFRDQWLAQLQELVDPTEIDYLIVSHTEPDHSGLVGDVVALNPDVVVCGSKVALQFLSNQIHRPFQQRQVKSGETLDLGLGHVLEFLNAPNLHWPDTIFTYDPKSEILFTCDAFGLHYCSDPTFDEDLGAIEEDFAFYYECLMAPNARSVVGALKRMDQLPAISTIAVGHGPLLRHNLTELVNRYRQWSGARQASQTTVAVCYCSDYGFSDRLSQAIARGITKTGIAVEMVDLRAADPQELMALAGSCQGLVVGTPPAADRDGIRLALNTILGAVHEKQSIGVYDAFGGNDEPIDTLLTDFRNLGLHVAFPPIRIRDVPTEADYQLCEESGTDLGQWLGRDRTIKQMKSLDHDLDKALGRISGGLYIVTAQRSAVKSAMLASWVSQASFQPLGLSIAVAKDRAIESFLQVGDEFVLNVLEEGNYQPLMKHFLKRFPPGADRFEGIDTLTATNGGPILADALAYLECRVLSRMDGHDHWLVYAEVTRGKVARQEGRTAVHHRKVGNHY